MSVGLRRSFGTAPHSAPANAAEIAKARMKRMAGRHIGSSSLGGCSTALSGRSIDPPLRRLIGESPQFCELRTIRCRRMPRTRETGVWLTSDRRYVSSTLSGQALGSQARLAPSDSASAERSISQPDLYVAACHWCSVLEHRLAPAKLA